MSNSGVDYFALLEAEVLVDLTSMAKRFGPEAVRGIIALARNESVAETTRANLEKILPEAKMFLERGKRGIVLKSEGLGLAVRGFTCDSRGVVRKRAYSPV